jgi:hypothetical protein
VILIIGILVAGVTQSSRLIRQVKLSSARSLTISSSVVSIKDLHSWYETILVTSFDPNEAVNATKISSWLDSNPQSSDKINMTQSVTNSKPTYIDDFINGLPVIYFDGTSVMQSSISAPAITSTGSATVFFVANYKELNNSASNQRYLITQNHNNCSNTIEIGVLWDVEGSMGIHAGCGYTTQTPSAISSIGSSQIISLVMLKAPLTPGVVDNIKIYRNGISMPLIARNGGYNQSLSLSGGYAKTNSTIYLGGRDINAFFKGYVGEIIIYSRSLNDDERKDIEKYLGKKWGIAVQ